MPIITVSYEKGQFTGDGQALLHGVREALTAAFSLPPDDDFTLLRVYEPEYVRFPKGQETSILVEVSCFSGRSAEQKERFFQLAARAVTDVGGDAEHMLAVVHDITMENWGVWGGQSAKKAFAPK